MKAKGLDYVREQEKKKRSHVASRLELTILRAVGWLEHKLIHPYTGRMAVYGFTSKCPECLRWEYYTRLPLYGMVEPYHEGYLGAEVTFLSAVTLWCPWCDRVSNKVGVTNMPINVTSEFTVAKEKEAK